MSAFRSTVLEFVVAGVRRDVWAIAGGWQTGKTELFRYLEAQRATQRADPSPWPWPHADWVANTLRSAYPQMPCQSSTLNGGFRSNAVTTPTRSDREIACTTGLTTQRLRRSDTTPALIPLPFLVLQKNSHRRMNNNTYRDSGYAVWGNRIKGRDLPQSSVVIP